MLAAGRNAPGLEAAELNKAEPESAVLSAAEARALLLGGRVTGPLRYRGRLNLSGETRLTRLPDGLSGDVLDVSNTGLTGLPEGLNVGELVACNLPLRSVPASTRVRFRLVLDDNVCLTRLPQGLTVGSLSLQGCLSLETLPEELDVCFLNVNRCEALNRWPVHGQVRFGHLSARDCLSLRELPAWLTQVAHLDLSGCRGITALPPALRISGWLDVAGSGLQGLPEHRNVSLRWRGVRVDSRLAFHPEELECAEILSTRNVELRRVMLERVGYGRFLDEVGAQVLDRDRDAGGERLLVRVALPGDEDFVAVCFSCPSTGRRYALRVPPGIRSGHAASAWLAGFDDASLYRPLIEA
ncbi:DUF6745 domain-containing protein [Deinococcus altitudinis]|uniref:DUF6745 domain-containing protein n=1 Tax=Deinococcus altitudinis TaxID=468914 RepID=UPI0038922F0B